jgi:hypothetical protein
MSELGAVPSARADFVEEKFLAVLDRPLEVSGTLSYDAPSHLEKRTLRPRRETLVVDGDTLSVEEGGGRTRTYAVQSNPVLWGFVESIRSTLAGDLPTLRRFYDVQLDGGEADWLLRLRPNERAMRDAVKEIRIGGRGPVVRTMEILDAGGDRSVMRITPKQP